MPMTERHTDLLWNIFKTLVALLHAWCFLHLANAYHEPIMGWAGIACLVVAAWYLAASVIKAWDLLIKAKTIVYWG